MNRLADAIVLLALLALLGVAACGGEEGSPDGSVPDSAVLGACGSPLRSDRLHALLHPSPRRYTYSILISASRLWTDACATRLSILCIR